MRPPHYTGENVESKAMARLTGKGFNEAPALHGGKHEAAIRLVSYLFELQ